jgi:hypothetical protein
MAAIVNHLLKSDSVRCGHLGDDWMDDRGTPRFLFTFKNLSNYLQTAMGPDAVNAHQPVLRENLRHSAKIQGSLPACAPLPCSHSWTCEFTFSIPKNA